MPEIGDIVTGVYIDRKGQRYIWVVCPDCQEERWAPLQINLGLRTKRLCQKCNPRNNSRTFNQGA